MKLPEALTHAYDLYRDEDSGKPAGYITALAHADPMHFGIAAMDMAGEMHERGDTGVLFSMQSISKVFMLLLAYKEIGQDKVYEAVGVQPYGEMYNSIDLMPDGRAFNPMVNAGAITIAGLLYKRFGDATKDRFGDFMFELCGENLMVDPIVLADEGRVNNRNMAICYLLRQHKMIPAEIDAVIGIYNYGCSLECTAKELAIIAAVLANRGKHPKTGKQIIEQIHVQHTLSIMLTCGMYSGAGQWAIDIGVPAKSGVAGGLIAPVLDRFGLAVYSPLLDEHGNSVRAIGVANDLDDTMDIHALMPLRK